MDSRKNKVSSGGILGGKYRVLSRGDVQQIHHAALDILESTGVAVYSALALDLLEQSRAKVDRSIPRAWLPKSMVEDAIAKAPSGNG